MTFALLTVLLNTATEYEAQVVREVAIRAGLMWTCSGCGRHHPADTPICPECATTAGPALFRRFPSAPAAPGIVAAAWIALSTALDARRASPNTTTRPEDLIQVGVGLRLTPVLHHAVTVATSAEAASADHLWAQLTGQLPPHLSCSSGDVARDHRLPTQRSRASERAPATCNRRRPQFRPGPPDVAAPPTWLPTRGPRAIAAGCPRR